ncbi:MAG: phosphatidylglycerol lysyltransferase domain-containing protein [Bacteroidales bacterium]|jgi:hypothetical protein|nr:phosphatidylglycerol lysyltransferase domain-containing protein [Bacteroidales bacterium]
MLNFHPLQLTDKQKLDIILSENNFRSSDLSFANLYSWSQRFNPELAIFEHTFFMRSNCSENDSCYMFPIGKLPINKSLNLMIENAKLRNLKFQIIGATREMWNILNEKIPNRFHFLPDRNSFEYIYLSQNLINLQGKKLQSKRNHINRFKIENPDWKYSKITTKIAVAKCLEMLLKWELSEHDRLEKSQQSEFLAVKKMLENFEILNLIIGGIYVNNNLVAFSIGEKLTNDTFVVHCEKAYSDINGAYSIINQQFIINEAKNFTFVNREEDLGIENLRKAKMSYYPEILLEKGVISEI